VSGSGTVPIDPSADSRLNNLDITTTETPHHYQLAAHSTHTVTATLSGGAACDGRTLSLAVPAVRSDHFNYGPERHVWTPGMTVLTGSWSWTDSATPSSIDSSWNLTGSG
jgi:hypothetical protein